MKRKDVEDLLPRLASGDAFERLEAESRLRSMVERDFGFRWDDTAERREAAIARVRAFLEEGRRAAARRRAAASGAGVAALDLSQLQGMTPEQAQEHLQKLLGKAQLIAGMGGARPRCEDCSRRPASVTVVIVRGRRARGAVRLCEPCAARRGEVRGG